MRDIDAIRAGRGLFTAIAAALASIFAPPMAAQAFPEKPIEIIVPFVAGGTTDVTARLLAGRMAETFGQPVIVTNRPGSGGTIGTTAAAKAQADGHTLLATTIAFAMNAVIRPQLPYRPLEDFAPIAELSSIPLMLLVHPSLKVETLQEFIDLAKSKPGKLNYATGGVGTSPHLAVELLKTLLGIDITHIPYKGNAEVSTAVLSGEVPITLGLLPPFIGHVKSGALKVLAVSTAKRLDVLPDTPTIAELGYPGFDVSSWQGLLAPAGTPPEVIKKLNAEVVRIMNLPEIRDNVIRQGAMPVAGTPEGFAEKIRDDIALWRKVVDDAKLKFD